MRSQHRPERVLWLDVQLARLAMEARASTASHSSKTRSESGSLTMEVDDLASGEEGGVWGKGLGEESLF